MSDKPLVKRKRGRPPRPVGRPSKISKELMKVIVEAIEEGNYVETAAQLAGVSKPSLYAWLKKGHAKECDLCIEFLNAVNQALSKAEDDDLKNIKRHAQRDWRASAWRLERRSPTRWGHKTQIAPAEIKDDSKTINEIIAEDVERLESDEWDD